MYSTVLLYFIALNAVFDALSDVVSRSAEMLLCVVGIVHWSCGIRKYLEVRLVC